MTGTGSLSEDDISVKFISPALHSAGWDETSQIRRQVSFTKGRIIVRGKLVARGKPKRADFVLYYRHIPLALIEAKKATFGEAHGMQQALDYAASLDIPFVFASNGKGFVFHDKTGQSEALETSLPLDAFPTPDQRGQTCCRRIKAHCRILPCDLVRDVWRSLIPQRGTLRSLCDEHQIAITTTRTRPATGMNQDPKDALWGRDKRVPRWMQPTNQHLRPKKRTRRLDS